MLLLANLAACTRTYGTVVPVGSTKKPAALPRLSGACAPSFRRPIRQLPPLAALPGAEQLPIDSSVRSELPEWLTLAGYAATLLAKRANLSSFQLAPSHIFVAVAFYTAVWGLLGLVDAETRGQFDTVGSGVGPIFLAVNALGNFNGRVAPFEVAAFLFGYFWVDKLPQFRYSRWVWLATLAAAIFKGFAAQWLVAALGGSALWKLVQHRNVHPAAFLGLAGWAFYAHVEAPVALVMMAAQIVASAVS